MAAGATAASTSKYLFDDSSSSNDSSDNSSEGFFDNVSFMDEDDDPMAMVAALNLIDLDASIDFDDVFVSATLAKLCKDLDAQHLSKVWRIDLELAKQTLEVTTQHCRPLPPQRQPTMRLHHTNHPHAFPETQRQPGTESQGRQQPPSRPALATTPTLPDPALHPG